MFAVRPKSVMRGRFEALPPDWKAPADRTAFKPSYFFFPSWDERCDTAAFQVSAGLSEPRQGDKATLFNFGDNPLTRIDGSSVEGVAYFVEKADEFYALRADYGPRFWLRGGNIVLETGEGTVLAYSSGGLSVHRDKGSRGCWAYEWVIPRGWGVFVGSLGRF